MLFRSDDPVLVEDEAAVRSPTVVIDGLAATMFFHEVVAGRGKIAAAVHP